MLNILFIILLIALLKSQLFAETRLDYEIFFGPVKLGESQIIIDSYRYLAIAKTTGIGNTIYPYFAKWISEVNLQGYPVKTQIYSKDRFKEREKVVIFEPQQKRVLINKTLPKKTSKEILLSFPLHDELTAFIASWQLPYQNNAIFELPLYIKEERHSVKIIFIRNSDCTFQNKIFSCYEILVHLPEKSELLKRSKEVRLFLWPEEKIPLEIRGTLPIFGSLSAKLKSYTKN